MVCYQRMSSDDSTKFSLAAPEVDARLRALPTKEGDIWSLGCVLSLAATWLMLGPEGLCDFKNLRHRGLRNTVSSANGAAFHDGKGISDAVRHWLWQLVFRYHDFDPITPEVLRTIRQCLLVSGPKRKLQIELLREICPTSLVSLHPTSTTKPAKTSPPPGRKLENHLGQLQSHGDTNHLTPSFRFKIFEDSSVQDARVDIVFIHGLGGLGRQHSDQWKFQPHVGDKYSFFNAVSSIPKTRLPQNASRPILFVAYSFGGIVLKQSLQNASKAFALPTMMSQPWISNKHLWLESLDDDSADDRLLHLFNTPYFQRTWVIQELASPQHTCTCVLHSRHNFRSTTRPSCIEKRSGRYGCRSNNARCRKIKSIHVLLKSTCKVIQDSTESEPLACAMTLVTAVSVGR